MRKFTKRELLNEGFWDNFKGVLRGASTLGAEVARKIAPEITDPLDKTEEWFRFTKEKVDTATNPIQAVQDFLEDQGLVVKKDSEIVQGKSERGKTNFIARVAELGYEHDKKGAVHKVYKFEYPKHRDTAIIQMDNRTKALKMLKRPRKDSSKESEEHDGEDVQTGQNVSKQPQTPP